MGERCADYPCDYACLRRGQCDHEVRDMAETLVSLSDDARFLLTEMPNHTISAPWGIIPGSQELLDNGCMIRDENIPYGRVVTEFGRIVRQLAA